MRFYFLGFLLLAVTFSNVYGQATFQSASGGSWNSSSRWTLLSGSDADGIPDSNDNIVLQSGHTISINSNYSVSNVIFNGGGFSFSGGTRTLTILNDVYVYANSSISGYSANQVITVQGDLTVLGGTQLSIPSITFSVNGSVTLEGQLSISGNSRTLNFGDVDITGTGALSLSGGNTYNFNGDLNNDGTFTANSYNQIFNFNSSSGVISGSNEINIFEANFNSPANYTNNSVLTIRDNMSGTGSFTNGNGAELTLTNGGPFTVSTFNAAATGNTIIYTGYGSPTGFTGSYYNLVLNKSSGTLGFSGSPSILNDLTIQDGIFQVGAVTVNIGNNLNLEDGEFTPDNASGVTNIGGNLNISGGEYDHNSGTVNVTGNLEMTGGDILFSGGSSTIDISGDFNFNGGTPNLQGGDFITNNLYVASGNEIFINGINLTASGQVELDGTMTFNNTGGSKLIGSVLVNATGNWNVTQPNNVTISGNITNNGVFTADPGYGTSVYTLTSSTGTLSGSGDLNIRDLVINSPASYTNETTLSVANTFTGSGTFTNGAGATFVYSGNNSSGTNFTVSNFDASAVGNTVVYAALTYNQQWRTTSSANNDYYNVTIETNTGDYQSINLAADVRVNGTLNIVEGFVQLGSFDLEMAAGATITGGDDSNYIRINGSGVVRQYFSSVGSTLSFPIGDSNDYSPITSFTVNSATLGANPYVELDITDANHPNRSTGNIGAGGNDDGVTATDYISRYWTLTGNDMTNPSFNVSYQYIDGDITGTEANMIAALYGQPPGETFFDWKDAGSVNAVNNTATITNGNYWGDLYAMDNRLDRLPVDLISFTVKDSPSTVILNWSTANEENNNYFSVERSSDGVNFVEIGTVKGAGNSNNLQTYLFEDLNPLNGRSYYRLKQIDYGGQFDYSQLVAISHKLLNEPSFSVYPNPILSGESVNLKLEGMPQEANCKIQVVGRGGEVVWQSSHSFAESQELQVNNLTSGIYIVRATSNSGFGVTQKLIVR